MTSGPLTHTISPPTQHTPLRLRLKPDAPATGYVDGGWWPRSRNLTTELPALAEALAVRLGRIVRVAYALSAWDPAPRRFEVEGQQVRLEGFTYQDKNIIHVTGTNRVRVSLLVIPSETTAPAGDEALMTAARHDNADRPEVLLAAPRLPAPRQSYEHSAQRWESEGGHVHKLD